MRQKKRKGKKNMAPRGQQTANFQDIIASMTLKKFSGYIDEEIKKATSPYAKHIIDLNEQVVAMQELLLEHVPGFTGEALTEAITVVVDRKYGLIKVDGRGVEAGDAVRCTVRTRLKDQEAFEGNGTPMMIHEIGKGNNLGKEMEEGVFGMRVGETKEIATSNAEAFFEITVDRISELKEKPETKEESKNDSDAE